MTHLNKWFCTLIDQIRRNRRPLLVAQTPTLNFATTIGTVVKFIRFRKLLKLNLVLVVRIINRVIIYPWRAFTVDLVRSSERHFFGSMIVFWLWILRKRFVCCIFNWIFEKLHLIISILIWRWVRLFFTFALLLITSLQTIWFKTIILMVWLHLTLLLLVFDGFNQLLLLALYF